MRKRGPSSKADPIEREIERALCPGAFIRDGESFSFVSGLDQVAATIDKLITTEPVRAVALYETFLAGCHAKADELDDSSGSFGRFAQELVCGWIKARQASDADPDKTASTLLAWMDDDPYAFCYEIEKDAAAAFDKAGLAAFEKRIRARFGDASADPSSWPYRRGAEILRAIYIAQRNIAAYIALAEETGIRPEDCLAVAKLLAARKPDESLAWVERGRAFDREKQFRSTAGYDLDKLHRELLTRLGRQNEALEAAWAEFREHPSEFTYDDLMKFVPKAERREWHEKALNAAKGADLHSLLELFMETREMDRLAELVRGSPDKALQNVSHYATEPAAKRLEKSHPNLAARLWRAQGMRIVDAKKSKYYDAALSNFERARDCYQKAGLSVEWENTVRQVSALHYRKTGFINGFQALAAGAKHTDRPGFLERAKARWGERHGGDNS
ncbi:MAG: hypothetical protein HYS04_18375 [Acidobacteria bacterium]|nr:hypothetical protein [Acidobacteriota bacterium]